MKAIDAVFSECELYDPNLTVTVDFLTNKNKNYIYANFDPVNILILTWLSKMIDFPLSKGFVCVCLKKE